MKTLWQSSSRVATPSWSLQVGSKLNFHFLAPSCRHKVLNRTLRVAHIVHHLFMKLCLCPNILTSCCQSPACLHLISHVLHRHLSIDYMNFLMVTQFLQLTMTFLLCVCAVDHVCTCCFLLSNNLRRRFHAWSLHILLEGRTCDNYSVGPMPIVMHQSMSATCPGLCTHAWMILQAMQTCQDLCPIS